MKIKQTILGLTLILSTCLSAAYAQSTSEYVTKVGKALNKNWAAPSKVFGKLRADVLVTPTGVVLYKSSGNAQFDTEAVRAANAVWDDTVQSGIAFPIEYRRDTTVTGFDYVEGVGYHAQ